MADSDLQALLDTDPNGRGIRIVRRVEIDNTYSAYYVTGGQEYPGRDRWVTVTTADSDEDKDTAIRAVLALP